MKEIKLDCFSSANESCKIISTNYRFEIGNPLDKQIILEIFNHSDQNCQLVTKVENFRSNEDYFLPQINLLISSEEKLFFQDDLETYFKQKTNFGSINSNSSKKYLFDFDFLSLAMQNQKILINFDLLFDFDCSLVEEKVILSEKLDTKTSTQAAVLAAETENVASSSVSTANNSFWLTPFFYLLSSLFIVIFFVIIKFANGKKKKNKQRFVV